jgi:GNAT superfamily N-acetyltransferase
MATTSRSKGRVVIRGFSTPEQIAEVITVDTGVVFVALAYSNGVQVGHCFWRCPHPGEHIPGPVAHYRSTPVILTHLHVDNAWRGRGLGSRLASASMAYARKQGWRVSLRIRAYTRGGLNNAELLSFYRDHGLRRTYTHNGETYLST